MIPFLDQCQSKYLMFYQKTLQPYWQIFIKTVLILIMKLRFFLKRKSVILTAKIFCALGVVFFLGLIIFAAVVDPNRYKNVIETFVSEKMDCTLKIQGPLTFSLLSLGIEAKSVVLKTKNKIKTITAENLKISPSVWSLIFGRNMFNLELSNTRLQRFLFHKFKTSVTLKKDLLVFSANRLQPTKSRESLELDRLEIDTSGKVLKYYLEHKGNNFQLPLLLMLNRSKHSVTGKTQLNMKLSCMGNTVREVKKSLSGYIDMKISNGKFHGIDLISSLKKARSFSDSIAREITQPLTQLKETVQEEWLSHKLSSKKITPFHSVKINANLNNGILKTPYFSVYHSDYELKGIGNIDLMRNLLVYRFVALYKEPIIRKWYSKFRKSRTRHPPLVIHVNGHTHDPDISPDWDSFVRYSD